jgi:hypothetical protein
VAPAEKEYVVLKMGVYGMRFNAVLNSVDPTTREEIERLHAVVDEFAIEMKARSVEQAMKSLRG